MATWLDQLIGLAALIVDGVATPRQTTTEFVAGAGIALEVADDPGNKRTLITITADNGATIASVPITFGATTIAAGASRVGTGPLTGLTYSHVIAVTPPSPSTALANGTLLCSYEIDTPGNVVRVVLFNPTGSTVTLAGLTLNFRVARFLN